MDKVMEKLDRLEELCAYGYQDYLSWHTAYQMVKEVKAMLNDGQKGE